MEKKFSLYKNTIIYKNHKIELSFNTSDTNPKIPVFPVFSIKKEMSEFDTKYIIKTNEGFKYSPFNTWKRTHFLSLEECFDIVDKIINEEIFSVSDEINKLIESINESKINLIKIRFYTSDLNKLLSSLIYLSEYSPIHLIGLNNYIWESKIENIKYKNHSAYLCLIELLENLNDISINLINKSGEVIKSFKKEETNKLTLTWVKK